MTKIKLTKEEKEIFSNFEAQVQFDNGLKWTNGAYAICEPEKIQEDNNNIILCKVSLGVQTGDDDWENHWDVYYHRNSQKFTGYEDFSELIDE